MGDEQPKLYTELAGWWQLFSPTSDYAEEAAFFRGLFRAEDVKTILELGSGGGNVAWFLKKHFTLTLTDLSEEMLAESAKQNPDLEHVRGDMRTLRLGRTFDGVLIHDAIMYMSSEEDLRAALLHRNASQKSIDSWRYLANLASSWWNSVASAPVRPLKSAKRSGCRSAALSSASVRLSRSSTSTFGWTFSWM